MNSIRIHWTFSLLMQVDLIFDGRAKSQKLLQIHSLDLVNKQEQHRAHLQ